jgi:hypothetical protein
MSRTVNYRYYLDHKGEIELDEVIDATYERDYAEQRQREAALWDRRKSGLEKSAKP